MPCSYSRHVLALGASAFLAAFALGVVQSWREHGTLPTLDPDRLADARAFLVGGQTERAIAQLRMYAAIDARRPESWLRLGQALAAVGDRAGAIDALERSVTFLPAPAVAHQQLAELYLRTGRLDAARGHARIAQRAGMAVPAELMERP